MLNNNAYALTSATGAAGTRQPVQRAIINSDGSIDVASRSTGGTSINMSVQQLYTLRRSLGS